MRYLLCAVALIFSSQSFASPQSVTPIDCVAQRNDLLARADFDPLQLEKEERSAIEASVKLWHEGKTADALVPLHQLLDKYPISIAGFRFLAEAMEAWATAASTPEHKAGFSAAGEKYRAFYESLVESILSSGDGKSEVTAYRVLDVSEEYELVHYMHLEPSEQVLINNTATGRAYDRITAKNKAGKESVIFFDITKFWLAENNVSNALARKPQPKTPANPGMDEPSKH